MINWIKLSERMPPRNKYVRTKSFLGEETICALVDGTGTYMVDSHKFGVWKLRGYNIVSRYDSISHWAEMAE